MSHDALIEALSGYVETDEHGTVSFFNNAGAVHRTDGPAVIYSDGTETWYQHGKLHRLDGPAVIHANGVEMWYYKGERHRTGGPAVIRPNGVCHWFLFGSQVSEEEFIERVKDWA